MSLAGSAGGDRNVARLAARGSPVLVLALVLVLWIGARAVLWEPGEGPAPSVNPAVPAVVKAERPRTATLPSAHGRAVARVSQDDFSLNISPGHHLPETRPVQGGTKSYLVDYGAILLAANSNLSNLTLSRTSKIASGESGFASLAQLGRRLGEPTAARPAPPFASPLVFQWPEEPPQDARLSLDAWGLWRDEMGSSLAAGAPSYGRSQAGAALRYTLSPTSPVVPEAHVRVSAALDGARERDLALGVSARPLADMPVRLAAEVRATQTRDQTQLRAGVYAVSEIAPFDLPAGTTGEVYLQGGYVTGEFATPFIDGQARVTRDVAERGDIRIAAGGGAWGGAQEGAARLDMGPTASVSFPVGDGYARISADYRFRVAGDAEPDSGPALTLATGF